MADRFFVKVIKIPASASPNVRYAMSQLQAGIPPTNEILVPGVLPWDEYLKRDTLWDEQLKCVGLHAEFWEGSEVFLFPPQWRIKCQERAEQLRVNRTPRVPIALGIDPGEGVSKTVWTIVDELGVIYQMGFKTPDPSIIIKETLGLLNRYKVPAENIMLDAGGGKVIAGVLRSEHNLNVRLVSFAEAPTDNKRKRTKWSDRVQDQESKSAYTNRRAQMYGELAEWMDPSVNDQLFAIPTELQELHFELSKIPKLRDREGKLMMLPKNKRNATSNEDTLTKRIGHSPDHSDSLAIAVFAMTHRFEPIEIGIF
jgi:hypothetical protein